MPRIPLPSVAPSIPQTPGFTAPDVQPPADLTGRQLQVFGEAVQRAGAGLTSVALEVQDRIDENARDRALALLSEKQREVLWDGKAGFFSKVGQDAVVARDEVLRRLQQDRANIESGLENDMQRRLFSRAADQQLLDAMNRVDRHYVGESKTMAVGGAGAAMMAAQQDYANFWEPRPEGMNPQDPQPSDVHRQKVIDRANEISTLLGESDEQRAQRVLKATTDMHTLVFERLANSRQLGMARFYMQANRKEIQPDAYNDMLKIFKQAKSDDDAMRIARDVMVASDTAEMGRRAKELGRRVDVIELQPTEELTKWRRMLTAKFDKGEIDADMLHTGLSFFTNEHNVRVERRTRQASDLSKQAEEWALGHPLEPVEAMPITIREGLDRLGYGVTVSNIKVRANRSRAAILGAQLAVMKRQWEDINADYKELEQDRKNVEQGRKPNNPDWKVEYDYSSKKREKLRKNIDEVTNTYLSVLGQISLIGDDQVPQDPLDAIMRLLLDTEPAPAPEETGR